MIKEKRKSNEVRFGTWNFKTMLETRRVEEMFIEIENYKIGIFVLQEIR